MLVSLDGSHQQIVPVSAAIYFYSKVLDAMILLLTTPHLNHIYAYKSGNRNKENISLEKDHLDLNTSGSTSIKAIILKSLPQITVPPLSFLLKHIGSSLRLNIED